MDTLRIFPRALLLFALLFGCFVIPDLPARDVEVLVEDADLEIPLEGALIRSWDGTEYTCDENGRAVIPVPDDRQVVIQIAYPGYENRRITIAAGQNRASAALRLGGVLENQELVLEAQRPGTSETKSGRSVAITEKELARTAEIGLIEDVMTSIKLLPGVGYTSMFNARPSIRGGDPGDLMAALDGFYISEPYHWGGAYSIFDPRMVQSARLSHGVFSSRYGHTISGLLEITSKQPSSENTELDIAIATSSTDLSLSFPLWGKGGIRAMGRVTYWDTLVWAAKQLNKAVENESLALIDAFTTAPYIRSAALSADYQFMPDLQWTFNSYFGGDGVGLTYESEYDTEKLQGSMMLDGDYRNYLGFLITGLTYTPRQTMLAKGTFGFGFQEMTAEGLIRDAITARYSEDFIEKYGPLLEGNSYTTPDANMSLESVNTILNAQGRFDLDWQAGGGLLFAFGLQELYSQWKSSSAADMLVEITPDYLIPGFIPEARLIMPFTYKVDITNHGLITSAYALGEYASPDQRFGAELGLRLDHLFIIGSGFTLQTYPVLNPRLNLDFGLLKNAGPIDSLTLTAGTGLFSSVNEIVNFIDERYGIQDFDLRPNRSWTTVAGTKIDILQGFSFALEGYFKYVFDRAYLTYRPNVDSQGQSAQDAVNCYFDGRGMIFGFDLQLQKLESRYWDGWLSYTFTHARYQDPHGSQTTGVSLDGLYGDGLWYYPSFHRFHNINLVLNFKPLRQIGIATRLGLASGRIKTKTGAISFYPVQQIDAGGRPVGPVIQKYRRASRYDDNERTTWSIPLDMKISFYIFNQRNKVQTEIYLGAENILSLVYRSEANTSYNTYTGEEDTGSNSANYEMPIPMVSFGFKWSY